MMHVQRMAARARDWLQRQYDGSASMPLHDRLQLLAGCWICETALGTAQHESLQSMAHELQSILDRDDECAQTELLKCDAALVLVSVGILRKLEAESTSLEAFVAAVASGVRTLPEPLDSASLVLMRQLLRRLQCEVGSGDDTWTLASQSFETLLYLDRGKLVELALEIGAATDHGRRSLRGETDHLNAALAILLLHCLREYDLETGTALLRAMRYLGRRDDDAFPMAARFLLAQQQPDGRFGFLAPEVVRARTDRPDIDPLRELYLPLTVSCLWAIAEAADPDFLLFASIQCDGGSDFRQ